MFFFRLLLYLTIALLVSGCTVEAVSFHDGRDPVVLPQFPSPERLDETELQYLVKMSDLIVIGKVTETKSLVDPKTMREETEKLARKATLPNPQRYVRGRVYTIRVESVILARPKISPSDTIHIYSLGDPFSLHTRLVHFLPETEYLIFLSGAAEADIAKGLMVAYSKDMTKMDQVSRRTLYVVTGDSGGFWKTKNNDKLIRLVKKIAGEIPDTK